MAGGPFSGLAVRHIPEGVGQAVGGARDMWRNYNDMKVANTINADKYFHCKANCEAAQRGLVGKAAATAISELREIQGLMEGDPVWDRAYDQYANRLGRSAPGREHFQDCKAACGQFVPAALSTRSKHGS